MPTKIGCRGAMASYRIYFFFGKRAILGRHDFGVDKDQSAIQIAHVLFDTGSDDCGSFDLWQGTRRIPTPWLFVPKTFDQLSAANQECVVDTEERIVHSEWRIAISRRLLERLEQKKRRARCSVMPRGRSRTGLSQSATIPERVIFGVARTPARPRNSCAIFRSNRTCRSSGSVVRSRGPRRRGKTDFICPRNFSHEKQGCRCPSADATAGLSFAASRLGWPPLVERLDRGNAGPRTAVWSPAEVASISSIARKPRASLATRFWARDRRVDIFNR